MVLKILAGLLLSIVLLSCSKNGEQKQSVLIIAVESLNFSDIPCQDDEHIGFQNFCRESIRFTHAFTPSIASQAAMGSILTGLYPIENNLRNNRDFLSNQFWTVAEAAQKNGYKTSFYSSGAPILRKSGLHQGFEIFDDSIQPIPELLYRPALKNFELLTNWLKDNIDTNQPYFSIVYLSDLLFPKVETQTNLGETRNQTIESQINEIDESLQTLYEKLNQLNQWNNTNIILVGLNGRTELNRAGELSSYNLNSVNTQVALFVKPKKSKKVDNQITWSMDRDVSLVDLGRTLYNLVGGSASQTPKSEFEVIDLNETLNGQIQTWSKDRIIMSESAWPKAHRFSEIRYAFRDDNYLYINDSNAKVYNTLTDRLEQTSIQVSEMNSKDLIEKINRITNRYEITPWDNIDSINYKKMLLGHELWNTYISPKQMLEKTETFIDQNKFKDPQVIAWLIKFALEQKNISSIQKSNNIIQNYVWKDYESGLLQSKYKYKSPCLALIKNEKYSHQEFKKCEDNLSRLLLKWYQTKSESDLKNFVKAYYYHNLDLKIYEQNYGAGLIWDIDHDKLGGPAMVDLLLYNPEMNEIRAITRNSLNRKNLKN